MNIWTKNVNAAPLLINKADGVFKVSGKARGGNISVLGNFIFQQTNPDALVFADGEGFVIESVSTQPIDGLTIDPLLATAEVMIFYN